MNETKKMHAAKRMIHLSEEQEKRMAEQAAGRIQSFANELAQVQSRRCELMAALLTAHVTKVGVDKLLDTDVMACSKAANLAIEADSFQKWTDIKAMFAELKIPGPQPHLEWAAKRVGVTLFDPVEEESLIHPPTVDELVKVVAH